MQQQMMMAQAGAGQGGAPQGAPPGQEGQPPPGEMQPGSPAEMDPDSLAIEQVLRENPELQEKFMTMNEDEQAEVISQILNP